MLMTMTLKQLSTTSYVRRSTKIIQQMKIKSSATKNPLIFLERCIKNNVTPKSFCLISLIKSRKGFNIKKECSRKLIVLARNDVKQSMHFHSRKVDTILATLMLYA